MSTHSRLQRLINRLNIERLNQGRQYMNKQFKAIVTGIFYVITVAAASGVAEAGKNNGGGQSGGFGSGNGAMYGAGPTTGHGYQTRNNNRYRHQNQHQYRNGNGHNAKGDRQNFDTGTDQYSNDRYLNQKDFQAWLYQNQSQNHIQVQNMTRDGL